MGANLLAGRDPRTVSWDYIAGFFDGEGGLIVDFSSSRRVLPLALRISQKNSEVLDLISGFPKHRGIHSIIGRMTDGTHYLGVQRARDVLRMANSMKLVVKKVQLEAAAAYLEGKITGNELLTVLQEEHLRGRRKSEIPESALRRFPLTRVEAKKLARDNAKLAGSAANRLKMQRRAPEALPGLPSSFTSVDLMRCLDVGRGAALKHGRFLAVRGLVTIERIRGPGRPMLRFSKIGPSNLP